jgi:hypothetical protein
VNSTDSCAPPYNNPNGTGTPLFTDSENLVQGMATSAGYTATAAGTDYWVATYNGDSNNYSVSSGTNSEPVTINPPPPTVSCSVAESLLWLAQTQNSQGGPQNAPPSGAETVQCPLDDPDFQEVRSAWPRLSEAERAAVLAIVRAASKRA